MPDYKNKISSLAFSFICLLISGCDAGSTADRTERANAREGRKINYLISKIEYIKDKHGICYSIIEQRTSISATAYSFTYVPCGIIPTKELTRISDHE